MPVIQFVACEVTPVNRGLPSRGFDASRLFTRGDVHWHPIGTNGGAIRRPAAEGEEDGRSYLIPNCVNWVKAELYLGRVSPLLADTF